MVLDDERQLRRSQWPRRTDHLRSKRGVVGQRQKDRPVRGVPRQGTGTNPIGTDDGHPFIRNAARAQIGAEGGTVQQDFIGYTLQAVQICLGALIIHMATDDRVLVAEGSGAGRPGTTDEIAFPGMVFPGPADRPRLDVVQPCRMAGDLPTGHRGAAAAAFDGGSAAHQPGDLRVQPGHVRAPPGERHRQRGRIAAPGM